MRNPTITFETSADIEADVVSFVLADVARYEGVIDVQMCASTKVLSYKVRGYDEPSRTLTVQVWDEKLSEGVGDWLKIDADDLESVHVF